MLLLMLHTQQERSKHTFNVVLVSGPTLESESREKQCQKKVFVNGTRQAPFL